MRYAFDTCGAVNNFAKEIHSQHNTFVKRDAINNKFLLFLVDHVAHNTYGMSTHICTYEYMRYNNNYIAEQILYDPVIRHLSITHGTQHDPSNALNAQP